jgi:hypothetical protein
MDPLRIGQVIGVSGDEVTVQIDVADLHIRHAGRVQRVGRLGTFVAVPLEECTLLGYVTAVHGQPTSDGHGGASRAVGATLSVQLVGTITDRRFARGVSAYPTLGDPVRLALEHDFAPIFHTDALAEAGHRRAFSLGRFAIDPDFEVHALGKEFFAKHVAVMGNSGSGKSVTTAKILHEALRLPHTQIVLFDLHGEYLAAFGDDAGRPLPNVTYLSERNLVVPYWMLQFAEFERLFVDPHNPLNLNAQRVFLRSAFERLKRPAAAELGLLAEFTVDTPVYYSLEQLKTYAENLNDARFVLNSENYAFARLPFRQLPLAEQEQLLCTRRMEFNQGNAQGEVPHATFHGRLLGLVNLLEARLNDRRYDFLLRPVAQAARNPDVAPHLTASAGPGTLSRGVAAVIRQVLGQGAGRANLTLVDLSGLPHDVVDITVAALTRTLFDFNFWSPHEVRRPFLLAFEEAHNYLPRGECSAPLFARDAVERVAREGRKYGVSAMVITQRPSELSETILSQCNSMVLMRMNNPDDQNYVARVVSDQFRSLINVLPSLRPGEGFVIGDAVLMPMRTLIDRPPRMPRSSDVDFFQLWCSALPVGSVEQTLERWWRQDRTGAGTPVSAGAAATPSPDPPQTTAAGDGAATPSAADRVQHKLAELTALFSPTEKAGRG